MDNASLHAPQLDCARCKPAAAESAQEYWAHYDDDALNSGDIDEADKLAAGDDSSGGYTGILRGIVGDDDQNPTNKRIKDNTDDADTKVKDSSETDRVSGNLGGGALKGITAGVIGGSQVTAGGSLNIRADEALEYDGLAGAIAGGA